MNSPELAALRRDFVAFREEAIWLQTCFNNFNALFCGGPETDALLQKSAGAFFQDLNRCLIECWVSAVCRLTDPPVSGGHTNLSCQYLARELSKLGLGSAAINEHANSLVEYRRFVEDARNKFISHYDQVSVTRGNVLGEHHKSRLDQFVADLQAFNDQVGTAVGEGPLDYAVTSGRGDVLDLLSALRGAA
jgi:AbiU2